MRLLRLPSAQAHFKRQGNVCTDTSFGSVRDHLFFRDREVSAVRQPLVPSGGAFLREVDMSVMRLALVPSNKAFLEEGEASALRLSLADFRRVRTPNCP